MAFKIAIFVVTCLALSGAASVINEYDTVNPELALQMGEDELEDFWDAYLAKMEPIWAESSDLDGNRNTGCSMAINGDLGDPQPVFLRGNAYLQPTGNSGRINLNSGESLTIACSGSGRTVQHPLGANNLQFVTVSCVNDVLFSNSQFLSSAGRFGEFTCSSHAFHEARRTTRTCFGGNLLIEIGFTVQNTFFPLYHSCFDENRLEVLYTIYDQLTTNAVHQSGVTRPSFLPGNFFGSLPVNNLYTQVTQRNTIAAIVGQELANQYITSTQFLARGHLAAMTDFVFATGQRASFYFINVAPQFQPFNGGNWMWLEARLRTRIGAAGYNTIMYTGTFGVTQLRDQAGVLRDIYLHENRQIPVPLYYYKVAYDESRSIATAFVGINNPYYTLQEIQRDLVFCQDHCRGNNAFSWLTWQPDNIAFGYSFCCTLEDFRRTVPHLPAFTARNGLLT
jgi:hypothetical protein